MGFATSLGTNSMLEYRVKASRALFEQISHCSNWAAQRTPSEYAADLLLNLWGKKADYEGSSSSCPCWEPHKSFGWWIWRGTVGRCHGWRECGSVWSPYCAAEMWIWKVYHCSSLGSWCHVLFWIQFRSESRTGPHHSRLWGASWQTHSFEHGVVVALLGRSWIRGCTCYSIIPSTKGSLRASHIFETEKGLIEQKMRQEVLSSLPIHWAAFLIPTRWSH